MRLFKYISAISLSIMFVVSCQMDEDILYSLDYIPAPAKVSAIIEISQDNTGLVTIIPNAEGAQKYRVTFGDTEDETPTEYGLNDLITHTYAEGQYQVTVTAVGLTGLTADYTESITITFKAPENLQVTITQDVVNTRLVSVSATADYAILMDIYFGDTIDEVPVHALPGEAVTHTYAEPGEYLIRVVANSAGAATTELTDTVTISAASDPVNLPVDFESLTVNYAFNDFGDLVSSVVDNPDPSGINTSAKVGQSVKTQGAETWAGTFLILENPIDFSADKIFKLKVWSPKVGIIVKLKVEHLTESNIASEVDALTTVADQWEELSYDFSSIDTNNEYHKVVLFFDFNNEGDDATYYFDDIMLTN